MDADSNNNHDQTTFPQATGGFNFAAQATGTLFACSIKHSLVAVFENVDVINSSTDCFKLSILQTC